MSPNKLFFSPPRDVQLLQVGRLAGKQMAAVRIYRVEHARRIRKSLSFVVHPCMGDAWATNLGANNSINPYNKPPTRATHGPALFPGGK